MIESRRSPRREPLTRERVLRAAVGVVDREGIDALSMRRLAQQLGVEAMSLYRYVPSKAALLDGIHEAILAEVVVPRPVRAWTTTARAYARAFRKALVGHPNALSIFATRPAVTSASLRHVEEGLALLRSAGFNRADALSAFQVMVTFVVGHTLFSHAPAHEDERSSLDYRALDPAEFPTLVATAAQLESRDLDKEFEFGLDVLLAGFASKLG
jgi:TetR/AcrR family tetracycline transcriptional repressor